MTEKTIKVKMPIWWDKDQPIVYTDGIDTYCCDLSPSWFVRVPMFDYSGYFHKEDLEVIA